MTIYNETTVRYDKKLMMKLSSMRIVQLLTDTPFSYKSFEEQPSHLCALSPGLQSLSPSIVLGLM